MCIWRNIIVHFTKWSSLLWTYEEDGRNERPGLDIRRRVGGVVNDGNESPVDIFER